VRRGSGLQVGSQVFGGEGQGFGDVEALLRADEMTERRRAKSSAPCGVLKPPEILVFTFIILKSCSARLLVKGTVNSARNLKVASLKVLKRMSRL
jgi:hypothetical protein